MECTRDEAIYALENHPIYYKEFRVIMSAKRESVGFQEMLYPKLEQEALASFTDENGLQPIIKFKGGYFAVDETAVKLVKIYKKLKLIARNKVRDSGLKAAREQYQLLKERGAL